MSCTLSMTLLRTQVSPASLSEALSDWAEREALTPDQLTICYWIETRPDGIETRDAATLDTFRQIQEFPDGTRVRVEFAPGTDPRHATIDIDTRSWNPDRVDLAIQGRDRPHAAGIVAFLKDRFPAPPPVADLPTADAPSAAHILPTTSVSGGRASTTELTATLPLLRLRPAAALDLWRTLIDPAPGMRLESSSITVGVSTSEHKFDNMDAVLACDKLPDALFRIHMFATFLPEGVPYGRGDLVAVSFGAKPVVTVRGGSEAWSSGKLCTLKNAAKRLRSPYWWMRPWNSASLLVVVPSLALLVLYFWVLLTHQKAVLLASIPLLFVLVLIIGLGALDAFAFRLTQSRITRTSPEVWTRAELIGVYSLAILIVSAIVSAFFAWSSARP